MIDLFDIFQMEADGSLQWLESAPTFEKAKARIEQWAVFSPGAYLLLDQKTGTKVIIRPQKALQHDT
jgi:hypothetical protein